MQFCSITSRRYAAHARVLAESVLAAHPGSRLTLLLSDGSVPAWAPLDGVELLTPADIGVNEAELHRRATMYPGQGLAGCMMPVLLRVVLARGEGPVVFVDADGYVYDDLGSVAELAAREGIVLSPHLPDPNPERWGPDSVEQAFLRAGVFNGGFLAVGPGAEPFLDWWADRTARRCVFDEAHALLLEQNWLTLAPGLFHHAVVRDRGVNVAGWNLSTRDVEWQGDTPTIDGVPLRHFHFACSYDPETPSRLTALEHSQWWPQLSERPGVARLSAEYAERLIAAGYRQAKATPALYAHLPDGRPIADWMRDVYRRALIDAEETGAAEPPNPFTHDDDRFAVWVSDTAAREIDGTASPDGTAVRATDELVSAMAATEELLGRIAELESIRDNAHDRIAELERIRDDAVAWAQLVRAHLDDAEAWIAARAAADSAGLRGQTRRAVARVRRALAS